LLAIERAFHPLDPDSGLLQTREARGGT
jgi:hypothetical protein